MRGRYKSNRSVRIFAQQNANRHIEGMNGESGSTLNFRGIVEFVLAKSYHFWRVLAKYFVHEAEVYFLDW